MFALHPVALRIGPLHHVAHCYVESPSIPQFGAISVSIIWLIIVFLALLCV